jgi:hypothetical protein
MKKLGTLILLFTLFILLLWQLPWGYNFFSSTPKEAKFVLFSPVINDFLVTDFNGKGKIQRRDLKGNFYTEQQKDSLLPLFYFRQLMQEGRLPKIVRGKHLAPQEIRKTNVIYRTSPRDINAPKIGLYFLMESMSGRVDLEMPNDVFRFTNEGIEFVDMKTNTLSLEKSQRFTAVMKQKGCTFPIVAIHGNPTTRKNYDSGYLLVDSKAQLFQLKMQQGMPFFRVIPLPPNVKAKHPFITEFNNRKILGIMTDQEHQLYVITLPDYQCRKVEVPHFDPSKKSLTLIGNACVWTLSLQGSRGVNYYALDADDYSCLKTYQIAYDSHYIPGLYFTSGNDKFVYPRW